MRPTKQTSKCISTFFPVIKCQMPTTVLGYMRIHQTQLPCSLDDWKRILYRGDNRKYNFIKWLSIHNIPGFLLYSINRRINSLLQFCHILELRVQFPPWQTSWPIPEIPSVAQSVLLEFEMERSWACILDKSTLMINFMAISWNTYQNYILLVVLLWHWLLLLLWRWYFGTGVRCGHWLSQPKK